MYKRFFLIVFLTLILCLVSAAFLPQEAAHKHIYAAWYFKTLWFIIAIGISISIVNFIKRKDIRLAIVYFGFLLVLFGGFLTSLLGQEGFIEIKEGQKVDGFWIEDDVFQPLDFSLSLKDFSVEFYPAEKKGMRFVKSYKSSVNISNGKGLLKEGLIEVNKPLSFGGFSFYQYGYDVDLPDQTILQVVKDPGLYFVYIGYLILLTGMIFSFKRAWKI